MVQTVDYDGKYSDYGSNQDTTFKGVRPNVWVNLAEQQEPVNTPEIKKGLAMTK